MICSLPAHDQEAGHRFGRVDRDPDPALPKPRLPMHHRARPPIAREVHSATSLPRIEVNMPTAKHSGAIARPIDDVFAFVADGEPCPTWRSGVLDRVEQVMEA